MRIRRTTGAGAAMAAMFAVLCGGAAGEGMRLPVTDFSLDNGLEVVVIEDHRASVVTHMVWYRVGAADEPPGKSGIAHFLEHLMFKGTDTVASGEFSEQVALNGGSDNAFTGQDYTSYHQRIARDRLALVMGLEADRMGHLKLTADEVATEREVILEERAQRIGNSPEAQLGEQMDAALFLAHPYGKPIIGWEHEMAGLTLEDAVAFYDRYYTPANAILVIAGDVTPDEVRALAADTYALVENRADPGPRVRVSEPPQVAARRVIFEHPQASVDIWRRSYLAPSYSTAETGIREGLAILGEVLGGGASGRLYRSLVVDKKLATSANGYFSGNGLDYGEFVIQAVPAPGISMDVVETEIETIVAGLIAEGVGEDEMARARTELIASAIFDQDSQSRMARSFGTALTTGSSVEDVVRWTDDIRAVTPESVVEAARQFLTLERSVTGILRRPATQTESRPGAPS